VAAIVVAAGAPFLCILQQLSIETKGLDESWWRE
jgi:hypothetical protein